MPQSNKSSSADRVPFSFFHVKVCDFEVVCRPKSSIFWSFFSFFLSFSEYFSQGEMLWYCWRPNVVRLKKKREKGGKLNKWILPWSLWNSVDLCTDVDYCMFSWWGSSFKAVWFRSHERNGICLRKCRLTESHLLECNIFHFILLFRECRQSLIPPLRNAVWFLPWPCQNIEERYYNFIISKIKSAVILHQYLHLISDMAVCSRSSVYLRAVVFKKLANIKLKYLNIILYS